MDAERQLALLVEAGLVFSGELSPRIAFEHVLEILKRRHGVIRGVVTLLDARTQEIRVEVSSGLSDAGRLARYRLGEESRAGLSRPANRSLYLKSAANRCF